MQLKFLTGLAIAIALVSSPALACKGKKTAFSDDFARQDPSWVQLLGEFGVSDGRAQLKSAEGKFAAAGNDGDFFESGDLCADVIAPDYRGGSQEFGGILFGLSDMSNFHAFWISPPEGTAGVTAKKNGKWVNPASGRKADAINQRPGGVNNLRVTWKDKDATLYINDKQFLIVTVQPVANARFGLYGQTEGKVWQFRNYKITD